ncbi:hypothetical protein F5148DRAFT_1371998 [Russula earlei]|uniref:Uncharacterized protein n=1 Tax=Russula earlei TaxID=71964 RepID=A0ACC0TT46_9AGAM|nr:hypothetical protein F5148DRAFT_1371998 [Russula earlei]
MMRHGHTDLGSKGVQARTDNSHPGWTRTLSRGDEFLDDFQDRFPFSVSGDVRRQELREKGPKTGRDRDWIREDQFGVGSVDEMGIAAEGKAAKGWRVFVMTKNGMLSGKIHENERYLSPLQPLVRQSCSLTRSGKTYYRDRSYTIKLYAYETASAVFWIFLESDVFLKDARGLTLPPTAALQDWKRRHAFSHHLPVFNRNVDANAVATRSGSETASRGIDAVVVLFFCHRDDVSSIQGCVSELGSDMQCGVGAAETGEASSGAGTACVIEAKSGVGGTVGWAPREGQNIGGQDRWWLFASVFWYSTMWWRSLCELHHSRPAAKRLVVGQKIVCKILADLSRSTEDEWAKGIKAFYETVLIPFVQVFDVVQACWHFKAIQFGVFPENSPPDAMAGTILTHHTYILPRGRRSRSPSGTNAIPFPSTGPPEGYVVPARQRTTSAAGGPTGAGSQLLRTLSMVSTHEIINAGVAVEVARLIGEKAAAANPPPSEMPKIGDKGSESGGSDGGS